MNIFFLDRNPVKASTYMCDKHIVKQIFESTQILCTIHYLCSDKELLEFLYKPTYKSHPCIKWVKKSVSNYKWLVEHALALCHEYTYRYENRHKNQEIIEWCSMNYPNIPDEELTDPAQMMPPQYIQIDPIQAYRNYYWYNKRKNISMKWTKREKPDWWKEKECRTR